MADIISLTKQILSVQHYFKKFALSQINNALTFRNWVIGFYIVEYEQKGNDRADYGENTLKILSGKLSETGAKGFSDRNLRLCRQFYFEYPMIGQLLTAKFKTMDYSIWQLPTAKSISEPNIPTATKNTVPVELLIDKLSFTHIIELLKIDDNLKRTFYEVNAIKNNWTVEMLKRSINTLLYERTGMSSNKETMLKKLTNDNLQQFTDIIKSPYILEFLGIEEKAEFSETDLEQAIINHLQKFLIELGRGFCFEARQKRISFNNKHYKIDLVFYHRVLKCHILIDLKLGEFDHADAGQMNVYLNYYRENEMAENDNAPIGIILCSHKDNALVHYATGGLPQEVFVSKYKLQLPGENELKELIQNEVNLFNANKQ